MTLSSLNQSFRKDTRTLVADLGLTARRIGRQLLSHGSQASSFLSAAWQYGQREDGSVGDSASLKFTRHYPQAVDLVDMLAGSERNDQITLILGCEEEGNPVVYNLAESDASIILISGGSAAGKSGLMRTMAVSLAATSKQSQVQMGFIGLPSKHVGLFGRPDLFSPLAHLPHSMFEIAKTAEEAVEVLELILHEIAYRQEMNLAWPLLVLFIDNVDQLLQSGEIGISRYLKAIAEAAPGAGLRLILSEADTGAAGLHEILKEYPITRFAGRTEANTANGGKPTASSYLNGQGDFLVRLNGDVRRFQAAFIDDYDLYRTLDHLHTRKSGSLSAGLQGGGQDGVGDDSHRPLANGRAGSVNYSSQHSLDARGY